MADDEKDTPDTPEGGSSTEFRPITSQEELERVLGKRLERERAKFADYDQLREKASRLDEIEEANKTAEQRLQEQLQQAQERAQQAERSALQVRIAAELGVPQEAVHGDDEESMRAAAQKLVEWRDSNKRTPPPPRTLRSGSSGDSAGDGKSRAAAALRQLRGAH